MERALRRANDIPCLRLGEDVYLRYETAPGNNLSCRRSSRLLCEAQDTAIHAIIVTPSQIPRGGSSVSLAS